LNNEPWLADAAVETKKSASFSVLGPADDEIRIPRAAFGTAQQPRPIENGHMRTMVRDLDAPIHASESASPSTRGLDAWR